MHTILVIVRWWDGYLERFECTDGWGLWAMPSDLAALVQEAIEEWSVTAFHPAASADNPTLADYISAKIQGKAREMLPGVTAQHSFITPECRVGRGDEGAFEEAMLRARSEYLRVVEGWRTWSRQPLIHLILTVERPLHEAEKVEHLRYHLTDGRWHDDCQWCRRRRVFGGTGVTCERP